MITSLTPYPEYKESGLPWLGQVPKWWEVKRAKSLFRPVDERSTTGKEELLTVSSAHGIVPRKTANVTMFKAESYLGYKLCWPGDLVINSLWAWAGGLGVSRHHGIISSAYGVYRIRPGAPMIPAFVHEVVRSSSFNWELRVRSKGVWISRLQLTDIAFLDAPIHIPPPSEQTAIVRFLDWANGRLERAIRAKRKVIALLNEQKQTIIHRAVTRGVDPSVAFKPSGIPWLGDIPQHWQVRRLGHVIRLQTGFPFASSGFVQGSGTRLLRGINVTPSGLRWDSVVCWQRKPSDGLDNFELQIGDIALGMDRPIISSGVRAAAVQESDTPSLLLQRVGRLRPTVGIDAKFLLLLLRGRLFADYIAPIFTGISVPHLSPEQIKRFKVPLPPLVEQKNIVSSLEVENSGLDTTISRLEREIELLREYRTRLVSDVVSGKLDVREAAAQLPDEVPPDAAECDGDLADEVESADEEALV
jgi:type I restriction enzyme S subunit